MRKLLLCAAILCATLSSSAQKDKDAVSLPAFGKVDKADLELKNCDFDDKADAMYLIDEGQLEYVLGESGAELKRRVRIKILTDKGKEWADVHLRYRSDEDDQGIRGLEAQTYNLDAAGNVVITPVEKKQIYQKKLSKKEVEKAFSFPEVKVGSIIEYKYRKTGMGLVDWYFQSSIPVKYSRFNIDFPSDIEVWSMPHCAHTLNQTKKENANRYVQSYFMTNVPGLRDEPYIINEDFYRDRLETKITALTVNGIRQSRSATWVDVVKYLMQDEDFGIQLKKNIPRTAELDQQLKLVTASYDRMKTVYKYVQDNMQWNEYYGIWAFDGVKSAWKDKKGTVGEMNLILVNLLKDAGITASPILVSTHDNGVVDSGNPGTFDDPGFRQFDKVMAYVELDSQVYVLDASEKGTPVYLIPPDVLLTEGLVISKYETFDWGWRTLWKDNLLSKNIIFVNGEISDAGKMTGEVKVSSYDYQRLQRQPVAKKGKDKFIETYVTGANPGMTVDDVTFENLESDSLPLKQTIKFSMPVTSSGDYKYFSSNILTGLEKNPFLADNRFSDIFFGPKQSYTIIGNFTAPEGYGFEELPKNIKMIMPDTSIVISRISQLNENILMTKVQLDFKKPFYPASQYVEFQEFYKRLFELLNEQYVVRKKAK